ncbi:phosphatase PAP2 family protein [Sphingomonas crocodyli]|uniref:Phosphatase PAP2 family protein n=1 Tax=Sphingomonas crocodyli TaxID=1979270 RepID=A0A437M0I6_9SPHN|nr:phosphatase PAP2 family protein [Sphingomonas crocodyli]RVT91201.1 phosphatase PAP2 family protein [Sphingomonas crocodyli]
MMHRIILWPGLMLLLAGLALWGGHQPWEVPLAALLHAHPDARLLPAIVAVTRLGGAAAMIPFALAVVGFLLARGARPAALWLFAVIASGRIVVELLKEVIGRVRPDVTGHLVEVSSASFPSSHAAGSMLTVAAMLVLFRPSAALAVVCLMWPIAVGVSRLLLGVHWPGDVLAGWGFALVWTALAAMRFPPPTLSNRRFRVG